MRVGTPLGEYPFEFRRLERRAGAVVVVGLVAGLESSFAVEAGDLWALVRKLGPALAVLALLTALRRAAA